MTRTRPLGGRLYPLCAAGVLTALAVVVAWDVARYDWLLGYDAFANARYAEIVVTEWRLPTAAETGVWHTPPLWFAAAGLLQQAVEWVGWGTPPRAGQVLAAASAVALTLIVFLQARVLWPERRLLHLVALGFAAASPVLVRAAVMYHPETLAAALAAGGLLLTTRALRIRPTVALGAGAGLLLGLGALTRAWVLPIALLAAGVLALTAYRTRERRLWLTAAACAAVSTALVVPWLVHQERTYGSPLAFNREPPPGSLLGRRPASFYVGLRTLDALRRPTVPHARNQVVPQVYADWWGDWWLTWDARAPAAGVTPVASDAARSLRARQSWLGLLPTVLMVGGLIAVALAAIGRRDAALGLVPAAAAAVAVAFLLFQLRYPSPDGDTIKASYLLCSLPALALGAGFAVDAVARRSRPAGWALLALGVVTLALELPFLVL